MIPSFAIVRMQFARGRCHALWVPLVLVWIPLLLLAPLLLPLGLIACIVTGIPPGRTLSVLWGVLCGLCGTCVDVDTPQNKVNVRIV